MLESICVKKVATYNDIGIQITDLKKVNFIYGANGSGKTTITKLIDKPNETSYTDCSLTWKNGLPLKTLVYNKDFRDKNFNGKIDGVFTLGQATNEEIEAIKEMSIKLGELKERGIQKRESLEKLTQLKLEHENEFRENAWTDMYKIYETDFKEAFVGVMKKELFKSKVLDEFHTNTTNLISYDLIKEKSKTIFGKMPTSMTSLQSIDYKQIVIIEREVIWQKKIIGKADVEIAKLIQKLNLNDWVNEGRNYLQERTTCPFCQQPTISNEFKTQLESYFDETYTNDIKSLKYYYDEYINGMQNIVSHLQEIESTEKTNPISKLNINNFSDSLKILISQFISNKETLNNQIKEPSRSIELISVNEQFEKIQQLISSANVEITAHNLIVRNYTTECSNLINEIWKYLVKHNKTKIQNFNKKLSGLQRGIEALQKQYVNLLNQYSVLNGKIREANKNVTSVQPSIDNINQTLKSYGFSNFKIVPASINSNQYHIQREDGAFAEATLSEGEITFITFLYFLQLSKGSINEELITEERILIVDDPISSLDSNVLFVVSSLLKEIINAVKKNEGNIKQVILLTHNVYFHKEVSFIDSRTKYDVIPSIGY